MTVFSKPVFGNPNYKKVNLAADLDSVTVVSTDYDSFFDTIAKKGSIWNFSNCIKRTKSDNKTRIKINHNFGRTARGLPSKYNNKEINLSHYANIHVCSLSLEAGMEMQVNFYVMDPDARRQTSYFMNNQLVVLSAAMNYARQFWFTLKDVVGEDLYNEWWQSLEQNAPPQQSQAPSARRTARRHPARRRQWIEIDSSSDEGDANEADNSDDEGSFLGFLDGVEETVNILETMPEETEAVEGVDEDSPVNVSFDSTESPNTDADDEDSVDDNDSDDDYDSDDDDSDVETDGMDYGVFQNAFFKRMFDCKVSFVHKFHGIRGALLPKDLKRSTHQMTSSMGRIFLRMVMASIKLFSENFQFACNVCEDYGVKLQSPLFHGVNGFEMDEEAFVLNAREMYNSGMFVGKVAGCKNAMEGLPMVQIPTKFNEVKKRKRCNKFMRIAFDIMRKKMQSYFYHLEEGEETNGRFAVSKAESKLWVDKEEGVEGDIILRYMMIDGDLSFPRKLGNCFITYDVGFSVGTDNKMVTTVPIGVTSMYMLMEVLNGLRFQDMDNYWKADPKNSPIYKDLVALFADGPIEEILKQFLKKFDMRDEALERSLVQEGEALSEDLVVEGYSEVDYSMFLLDYVQDLAAAADGEETPEVCLKLQEYLHQMKNQKYGFYPLYCTDGHFGSAHSGKVVLKYEHPLNGERTLQRKYSGNHTSFIHGMQIYDPQCRYLVQDKVSTDPCRPEPACRCSRL